MSVTERVHEFGADDALTGIITLPAEPQLAASAGRPFVILLNAGIIHRVGPFGMSVQLARSLAARGFRVLRFDQSGLGDSLPRPGNVPIEEQVVADGRAAMDSLAERYGASSFVVGGLCSGALNAHRICVSDKRVVAMWMLDGYAYPTWRYHQYRFLRRIRNPWAWGPLARRVYAQARAKLLALRARGGPAVAPPTEREARTAIFYQDWPAIADARRDIERMLGRGVRMHFVYTGGWSSFVDARQFDDMFPRLGRRDQIRVTYYPWADHSFLALQDRSAMLHDVVEFVNTLPTSD
jgi:pimeloyl-ACP methyl ester carboxylesterase